MVDPLQYYRRREVAEEIASFLRGRWAALEGEGRRWLRWLGDRPLVVRDWSDVPRLVEKHRGMKPRSWYGTIEVFRRLETRSDLEEGYEANVEKATVFIDIDLVDEATIEQNWRCVVEAAQLLTDWLSERGVTESVYLLWSGAGMHLRINEDAFSPQLLARHHPLDVAFAVAEYILEQNEQQLLDLIKRCNGAVKIENLVAPKRVFTAPLSLHRRLDRVAVALRPRDLQGFTLDWSSPENPRHDPEAWRRAKRGEADDLAEEALRRIGRVKHRVLMEARASKLSLPTPKPQAAAAAAAEAPREPGRFPVMALLQAARYYLLHGDLEKAKSWGLNRAIFYAWAKYYGPARRPAARLERQARRYSSTGAKVSEDEVKWVEVAGEKAMVSPRGWFVIGGVEQRPEDFDRYVARRFEEAGISFEEAWRAALEYLRRFPRSVLKDPQRFYKEVYEPVRDRFVEKVLRRARAEPSPSGEGARTGGGLASLDKWLRPRRGGEEQRGG